MNHRFMVAALATTLAACASANDASPTESTADAVTARGLAGRDADLMLSAMIAVDAPITASHGGSDPGTTRTLASVTCDILQTRCTVVGARRSDVLGALPAADASRFRALVLGIGTPVRGPFGEAAWMRVDDVRCTFSFGVGTSCSYADTSRPSFETLQVGGLPIVGRIDDGRGSRTYRFEVPANGVYRAVALPIGQMQLTLGDASGRALPDYAPAISRADTTTLTLRFFVPAGTYTVIASASSFQDAPVPGSYSLRLEQE